MARDPEYDQADTHTDPGQVGLIDVSRSIRGQGEVSHSMSNQTLNHTLNQTLNQDLNQMLNQALNQALVK